MSELDRRAILAGAGVLGTAALAGIARAGPLNPPAGAVAGTAKPLSDVEPRIAVNATNTPSGGFTTAFRITQPGSYYLTGNVTVVTAIFGIIIAANDVTLDLNGFTVQSLTVNASPGISVSSGFERTHVCNGTVTGFGTGGVTLGASSRVSNVRAVSNGQGINVGPRSIVENCSADSNTSRGIQTGDDCVIQACTLARNGAQGLFSGANCLIRDCVAADQTGASGIGFFLSAGCVACSCTASGNSQAGFNVGNNSQVIGCAAYNNATHGFQLSDNTAIVESIAGGNTLNGINAAFGVRVFGCTAFGNQQHGIQGGNYSHISRCLCRSNGAGTGVTNGAGIFVQSTDLVVTIEDNVLMQNDIGLRVEGSNCIIRRNICGASALNAYVLAANNRVAPIAVPPNSVAIAGSTGGASLGSTDPNANFTY